MGFFDNLRCHAPLPFPPDLEPSLVAKLQASVWQTKDLDCFLDDYELRADGSLWHQLYDVEDRSDPTAEGLARLVGMLSRVNERWVPMTDYVGVITFYECLSKGCSGWLDFRATIVDGRLHRPIELLTYRPIDPAVEAEREENLKRTFESLGSEEPA